MIKGYEQKLVPLRGLFFSLRFLKCVFVGPVVAKDEEHDSLDKEHQRPNPPRSYSAEGDRKDH